MPIVIANRAETAMGRDPIALSRQGVVAGALPHDDEAQIVRVPWAELVRPVGGKEAATFCLVQSFSPVEEKPAPR